MPSPRSLSRSIVGAVAVLALVGTLVACGGSDDSAEPAPKVSTDTPAVVGDTAIARNRVLADLAAEADAAADGRSAASTSALADPAGDRPGTYTPAAKAAALTNRMLDQIYAQTLAAHDIAITDADRQIAHESLCGDQATGQAPADGSCPPLAGYPKAYRAFTQRLLERQVAFGRFHHEAVYGQVRKTDPDVLREVCVNLAQVADAATGKAIKAALDGGKDMGTAISASVKAGKASEARGGCIFLDDAPESLQKAKDGTAVALDATDQHFVAQVLERRTATRAEFIAQPPSSATVRRLVNARVADSVQDLGVAVLDTWGTWSDERFAVAAPGVGEPAGTTTTPPGSTSPLGGAPTSTTAPPSTAAPATTAPD